MWLLLAVPVGLAAGGTARGVSWLISSVLELPSSLAMFPGLLLLALALSARAVHAVVRPPVDEMWWFLLVAAISSLFALA